MKKIWTTIFLITCLLPINIEVQAKEDLNKPAIKSIEAIEPSQPLEKPTMVAKNPVIQTGKIKVNEPYFENIETTETLKSDRFNKYEPTTLTNVIKRSTSVNPTRGARGESIFRFRGFNQSQVPVLLDGIPIYVPYDGIVGLDRIPSDSIEEVRLIKGAPSIIYGPNALGGAINIISRKPVKPFELKVGFNDNYVNTLNENIYLGVKQKNVYFTFNHSFSKSHGFNMARGFKPDLNENGGIRNNSAYHNIYLGGMLGYSRHKNQDYRLTYNFISSPWDVPTEVGINRPRYWRFSKWRKNTAAFSFKQGFAKNHFVMKGNVYYDKYYNLLNSYDNNSFTSQNRPYAFESTYDDYTVGFNIIPEININKYLQIKPVFLYKKDVHRQYPDKNQPKETYRATTTTLGGEIVLKPTEKLRFVASVSADRQNPLYNNGNPLRDTIWTVNATGGASVFVTPNNEFYCNIGRKTRFPTLKELYSGFIGRNIPNPDLEHESAFTYEFGYKNTYKERTSFNIAFYQSYINNLIINVPIRTRVFQLQNIGKAKHSGIDANFNASIIKDKLNFHTGYSFLYATDHSSNRTNNYIPYSPKHKLYSGFDFNLPWDITGNLDFMYVSTILYQDNLDLQWKKLGGYPIIDFSIKKTFKDTVSAYVSIRNMLNKNYETEARFPMPGISVVMGLKMEI